MRVFIKLTIALIFFSSNLFAQHVVTPDGGGEPPQTQSAECLSAADYVRIEQHLQQKTDSLLAAGVLSNYAAEATVPLDWPIKAPTAAGWNSVYMISNFVDQDPTSGIEDYNCGSRSYNGHKGIDIATWPFGWYLMHNDLAEIVSAADGVILSKFDGEADSNCNWTSGQQWNAVYVKHSDKSVAWYGHMKKGSLTSKLIGQSVTKGEYLGVVASSGISTGPHLHFELHDSLNNTLAPYSGTCNTFNTTSCWASQKNYRDPTLNALLTHNKKPDFGCPSANETPYMSSQFGMGDSIYFAMYYHDESSGDVTNVRVYKPDNTLWDSWTHNSGFTYSQSWWWWKKKLPSAGPFGTWKIEADYKGTTTTQTFNHGWPVGVGEVSEAENQLSIAPNPMKESCVIITDNAANSNISLELFNVLGAKQYVPIEKFKTNTGKQRFVLHRAGQASGVYFLVIKNEDGILQQRKIIFE